LFKAIGVVQEVARISYFSTMDLVGLEIRVGHYRSFFVTGRHMVCVTGVLVLQMLTEMVYQI